MQAFDATWFLWLFIMTVSGIGIVVAFILFFYLPNLPGRPPAKHVIAKDWPEGIQETPRGIPVVLWLVLIVMTIYLIAHFIQIWMTKPQI